MQTSVLIATSDRSFSDALAARLSFEGFSVVGTTTKRTETEGLVEANPGAILIYDLNLSDCALGSMTNIIWLKNRYPDLKILGIGFHESICDLKKLLQSCGFDDYWCKLEGLSDLLGKMRAFTPTN